MIGISSFRIKDCLFEPKVIHYHFSSVSSRKGSLQHLATFFFSFYAFSLCYNVLFCSFLRNKYITNSDINTIISSSGHLHIRKMGPRESAVLLSLAVFSVFSFGYLFPFFPVSYWLVSSCSASASCWDCKAVIMWLSLSSPSKNSSAPCSVIPILWSVTRPLGKTCSFLNFEGGYTQEAVQFFFFNHRHSLTIIHEGEVNIFE